MKVPPVRLERVKAPCAFRPVVRVASLVPGGTEIALALGLRDEVVAVTEACATLPGAEKKPRCVRSVLPAGLDSAGIDQAVRAAAVSRSLYALDLPMLRKLKPDVLLTQELCDVCAASRPDLERILAVLPRKPRVVTLSPRTVEEVLASIIDVGIAVEREAKARRLVAVLEARLEVVAAKVAGARPVPTVVLEWLDPPMTAGHWLPDAVARAGGQELLGIAGKHARYLDWSEVRDARPDVLALAPCGLNLDRIAEEGSRLIAARDLRAPRIAALDADALLSRPGPSIVAGVEALAALLHPDRFTAPPGAFRRLEVPHAPAA